MRFSMLASLLSILFAFSFAWAQESRKSPSELSPASLELKLINSPRWTGNCLELDFERANVSNSPVLLNKVYEGLKIYSSVRDVTNALGQGSGESWMLVYGWTDVVSEPIEFAPGKKKRTALCIADTFPVKPTGKETFRQVRLQGTLRVVAEYEIPTWKGIYHPQLGGRETYVRTIDKSGHWTLGEIVMKVPVPCPNGADVSDCSSPPEIFAGEHDVHTIEPEPAPEIEFQPQQPAMFPIDRPIPPKPQ
jgi:hypothetical protein